MDIKLKTFKGGNVTPQNDAIIYQTVFPGAGAFKGCEVSVARNNVLHISQGFGMIKGRFFEMYETEVSVLLADTGETKLGRIYIHMDLSNTDEPVQILTEIADELSVLEADANVNYNNTTYDMELAKFKVTSTQISDLENTFKSIAPAGGGGGSSSSLEREKIYAVGDTVSTQSAPGWCTLYCTQAGTTDVTEPKGYSQITKVGDTVLDGTAVFTARNIILELTEAKADILTLDEAMDNLAEELKSSISSTGSLVQKVMSISEYKSLETYNNNTIYYCYDNEDTQEIKCIYLGEHIVFATGLSVTYQIDVDNAITQSAVLSSDAVQQAPTVTKDGYTFVGWKSDTNADKGVLTSYPLNSETSVTLYAVFKKQITISMDSGDATLIEGKEESSQKVDLFYNNGTTLSEEVLMPENIYELGEDKSFCGWKTSLSSEDTYVPGEKYKFTKDEMLVPAFIDTEYDFLRTDSSYYLFLIPADGIYEFDCFGSAGSDVSGSITVDGVSTQLSAKGGKGGHAKAYGKFKKGTKLYVCNGNKNGNNGGGKGYSYTSGSNKYYGANGGGLTYIGTNYFVLSNSSANKESIYKLRNEMLLVAGGGGGAGICGSATDGTAQGQAYKAASANDGGYAGGERGQNGSGGNPGGRQTSIGNTEYYNFAIAPNLSTSSYAYSGGGAGWFAGETGLYGNSGAGGSSYVGNMPTFAHKGKKYKSLNEANVNEGNGYSYIRYMEPCIVLEEEA